MTPGPGAHDNKARLTEEIKEQFLRQKERREKLNVEEEEPVKMKHRVKISVPRSPKPKREKSHALEAKDINSSIVEKQEENEEDEMAKALSKYVEMDQTMAWAEKKFKRSFEAREEPLGWK